MPALDSPIPPREAKACPCPDTALRALTRKRVEIKVVDVLY